MVKEHAYGRFNINKKAFNKQLRQTKEPIFPSVLLIGNNQLLFFER